jgi:hypothetical protein
MQIKREEKIGLLQMQPDETLLLNSSVENFRPSKYQAGSKGKVAQSGDEILQVNDILSARNKILSSSINFSQGPAKSGGNILVRTNLVSANGMNTASAVSINSAYSTVGGSTVAGGAHSNSITYNNYVSPRHSDALKACSSHRVLQMQDLNQNSHEDFYSNVINKGQRSSTVEKSSESRPKQIQESILNIENYFTTQASKKSKYIQPGSTAYIPKGASGVPKESGSSHNNNFLAGRSNGNSALASKREEENNSGSNSMISSTSYDERKAGKFAGNSAKNKFDSGRQDPANLTKNNIQPGNHLQQVTVPHHQGRKLSHEGSQNLRRGPAGLSPSLNYQEKFK